MRARALTGRFSSCALLRLLGGRQGGYGSLPQIRVQRLHHVRGGAGGVAAAVVAQQGDERTNRRLSLAHANVRFHFALLIQYACVRSLVFLDLEADLTDPFVEARLFPSHRLEPQKIVQLCGALLPSPWLVFELEPPLTIVLTQLPATELYALVCMYVSMYFYVCRVGNDTKRNAGASFRRPRRWRRAREPARAAVCEPRARQGVCASCLCLVNGTAALVLCAG